MGDYRSKNTEVLTQKTTTIKILRLTYMRNCFCKNIPKERLYPQTGLARSLCKLSSCPGQQTAAWRKKGSITITLCCLLCLQPLGSRWLLQLWPKAASPGPRSRKAKHFVTRPSMAGAAWHLGPGAVTFNLPVLLRALELIPRPATTALVFVFSELSFL